MKILLAVLAVLMMVSCYWQPPVYEVGGTYNGDFITSFSADTELMVLFSTGSFSVDLSTVLDDDSSDVVVTSTKVSLGEFVDAGTLEIWVELDGKRIGYDKAEIGRGSASIYIQR